GVLRIGGDRARCVALLRHIAAELATSHTAEDTEVLLVGLGDELPPLNPEQLLVVPDLPAALTEIEHRTASVGAELQRLEIPSAVEGRLRDVAADSWLPTVLLMGTQPDQDERVRLDTLAAADPGSNAVAVVVFDPPTAELLIGDDGLLELPDIDDGPWQAAQLTENAGTHLAAILGSTAEPPNPVGPAGNPEPWASGMQDDGSLDDPGDGGGGAETDIPRPRQPEPAADPDAARRLAIVDHQDPHLDDDLTAWHGTGPPSVPMIAILGEPAVRAPGQLPTARPSWFAEVLVYLALHPVGVTTAKAVTDLWSDGQRIRPATIRHALYGARRWAGGGLGGDPDATFVSGMQNDSSYRLRGHLLDWDLFRRLRKRAQARHAAGHPGAVPDYTAALALIRGPVFSGLRPGGYAWLNNHDQRHDLQIPGFIVDTAHELVDIALAAQDTVLARRAAEHARMVDIDVAFDRPLIDLMRIAHAEDNRSELEMYATVLLDARGFEVPEELAPDSFAVLNELLPAGPRRPRP
ncbi:MAG: bacterial transcriptional activator domain-containing protein, partial [Pseudonocardia sp.]|nr:bacterial transcriptional activator domain-containing protein [Pseudonocardia sp.]